jgi:hypothetical protein
MAFRYLFHYVWTWNSCLQSITDNLHSVFFKTLSLDAYYVRISLIW